MIYREENIIEKPDYTIQRYYPASQTEDKKRQLVGRIGSSKVSRRIILESDHDKEDILKARVLLRQVIHKYVITPHYQWAKTTIEGHTAPNKEQIYKWKNSGYKKAYEWLKSRGVEEPEASPLERNVELFGKEVTAMWLIHNLNGKKLHKTLRKYEFTVPLIASELVRLKY